MTTQIDIMFSEKRIRSDIFYISILIFVLIFCNGLIFHCTSMILDKQDKILKLQEKQNVLESK